MTTSLFTSSVLFFFLQRLDEIILLDLAEKVEFVIFTKLKWDVLLSEVF